MAEAPCLGMDKNKYSRKDWGPGQAQQSVALSGFHCLLRQHHQELIGHTLYSNIRGTTPIMGSSSSRPHLPSTPLPDTLMLELRLLHVSYGRVHVRLEHYPVCLTYHLRVSLSDILAWTMYSLVSWWGY